MSNITDNLISLLETEDVEIIKISIEILLEDIDKKSEEEKLIFSNIIPRLNILLNVNNIEILKFSIESLIEELNENDTEA